MSVESSAVKVPCFRVWHATLPSGLRAKSRHFQYAQGFFADTRTSLRDEKYRRDYYYTHVEIGRADYQHAAKAMPPEEVNERRPSLHTVIYNFKHNIISTCQSVSRRNLQQSVDEFTTRFNHRFRDGRLPNHPFCHQNSSHQICNSRFPKFVSCFSISIELSAYLGSISTYVEHL